MLIGILDLPARAALNTRLCDGKVGEATPFEA